MKSNCLVGKQLLPLMEVVIVGVDDSFLHSLSVVGNYSFLIVVEPLVGLI